MKTSLTAMFVSLALLVTPHAIDAQTANIAAWNVAGFTPIPIERVPAFVEAVKDIHPDVLVLAEVNPSWIASELVADLLNDGQCYQRHVPDQPRAHQLIALIHKCDVTVSEVGLISESDLGRRGYREALTAKVKVGQFDFVLIGVHLKAGRGTANRGKRSQQASVIADFVTNAVSDGEKDIILLGDYNMIPGQDQSTFQVLGTSGYIRFISSEVLANQFSHINKDGSGTLLDGYGIATQHTHEYVDGSLRIVPLNQDLGMTLEAYRDNVSDHLPVVATFKTDQDDD